MEELLLAVAKGLVEDKDAVKVTVDEANEDGIIVYHLTVAEDDMGRVIGKQGRIAKAIRVVMRAAAVREGTKVMVSTAFVTTRIQKTSILNTADRAGHIRETSTQGGASMKKHVCAAALALCFVLAACAPEPGASSASVPSSSAAASSLPPASGTAGQAAPPLDLPYEKIQPVADHATPYPYLACGFDGSGPVYYTMCRGGLWGVVLECRAPQPVARCHLGHWSWGSDGMNWDELDAVNARLSETGDGALEVGHGGSGTLFYWDVAASAPGFCRTGEAAQAPSPVTAADYERYGVFLPVQLSVMAESEMTGGLYPQPIGSAFCYNFAGPAEADAPHLLTEEAYEAAGWFREGLGSVYKNGKTAYLNAEGRAVTDFLYDGVWAVRCATQSVLDEKTATYADEAVYARPGCGYPLRSGYAPVCRDGLWGFLNADGAEAVPCRYEYACPTPDGLALVRENGVWSLVEPAALAA